MLHVSPDGKSIFTISIHTPHGAKSDTNSISACAQCLSSCCSPFPVRTDETAFGRIQKSSPLVQLSPSFAAGQGLFDKNIPRRPKQCIQPLVASVRLNQPLLQLSSAWFGSFLGGCENVPVNTVETYTLALRHDPASVPGCASICRYGVIIFDQQSQRFYTTFSLTRVICMRSLSNAAGVACYYLSTKAALLPDPIDAIVGFVLHSLGLHHLGLDDFTTFGETYACCVKTT